MKWFLRSKQSKQSFRMFQTRLPDADPRTDASGLVDDTDDIIDDVKIKIIKMSRT